MKTRTCVVSEDAQRARHKVLRQRGAKVVVVRSVDEAIEELEANFALSEADIVRAGLLGYWKVLITSSAERANMGMTGFGAPDHASVLAHFQCYSTRAEGSIMPTLQTVEIIADSIAGSSSVAALKG